MNRFLLCFILTISFSNCFIPCFSKNILVFIPICSKSVKNMYTPLIAALASRGHKITTVSAVRSSPIENVIEIVPYPTEELMVNLTNPFELRKLPPLRRMAKVSPDLVKVCTIIYEQPEFQNLKTNPKGKFDLVIMNAAANHCFFGLINEFYIPIVGFLTFPPSNFVTEWVGVHLPYSFIPFTFLGFTDRMNFWERAQNVFCQLSAWIAANVYYRPLFNSIKNKYHGESSPSLDIIERNISLLLTNTHFAINSKLPLTPDVIEVGGMHLREAQKIEKGNLQAWLDESSNGFIYFSFGSIIQENVMPEKYKHIFTKVFANLNINVLWKWEGGIEEFGEFVPENVRLESWLPQQDVIGHPNAKLFISHGGLHSVQEAVYHAIPVLGFPFFFDQDQNLAYVQQNGMGKSLEILDITEGKLLAIINSMLKDHSYKSNAVQLSKIFHDQPQSPLERAIFWIEYILRHNGAPFMKSASRDLSSFQYHSLDVGLFFALILVFIMAIAAKILIRLLKFLAIILQLVHNFFFKLRSKFLNKVRQD